MSLRPLAVFDTQAGEVTTVGLADVAAGIRRYEVLGAADSGGITGAPAPRGGDRP
jgi:hypothetical protein